MAVAREDDVELQEIQTTSGLTSTSPLPKERDARMAGVYRHRLREEDLVHLPLNPMYGADLPSADSLGQGQDAAQGQDTDDGLRQDDQAVADPTTHTYENGETFGTRLGQPLNRQARRSPPVPPTPRPGRSTVGAQPVAAAAHVYEDGETFGMHLGPALNRDDRNAPPGKPTGGVQQVPGGPQPQDILSQLQPNQMYSSNHQPLGPAQDSRTIWERLRHRLSPRLLRCAAISSVALLTLMIVVPLLLTHLNSGPGFDYDSPATSTTGPNTTGRTVWPNSTVLMRTDKVTSADVIKINPDHGLDQPHGITAGIEAPTNMAVSMETKRTYDVGSSTHVITLCGDEPAVDNLRSARGVAVSADNKILVADDAQAKLQVYSIKGVPLCQFPPDASRLGHPSMSKTPSDVSIDRDGHLWVLMSGFPASPDSVVQFSRAGHPTTSFDLPDNVPRLMHRGMALDLRNNHVFITWAGHYRGGVQAFNPDGKLLWGVGPEEEMVRPMFAAVDGKGNIFVSDSRTSFVYMFDETGQFLLKFGGPGRNDDLLNRPQGICVDGSGYILVVDSKNRRVVKYTSRGTYVHHIALSERFPRGVAVGTGGQLVVTSAHAVTVFRSY
ncbi:TRIM3 [Branchiostoma lanceolatum]|uniref:TRIM3 protein n=1 Tax=Branchiostoma lanceolatum TaxID=7740 RepID=A0A8J9YSY4_BRALA|nr:TRIM3 [Branchiostoma lanceolatum]